MSDTPTTNPVATAESVALQAQAEAIIASTSFIKLVEAKVEAELAVVKAWFVKEILYVVTGAFVVGSVLGTVVTFLLKK